MKRTVSMASEVREAPTEPVEPFAFVRAAELLGLACVLVLRSSMSSLACCPLLLLLLVFAGCCCCCLRRRLRPPITSTLIWLRLRRERWRESANARAFCWWWWSCLWWRREEASEKGVMCASASAKSGSGAAAEKSERSSASGCFANHVHLLTSPSFSLSAPPDPPAKHSAVLINILSVR